MALESSKGNGHLRPNGHGSNSSGTNGSGPNAKSYTPPSDGGKLIVLTAPLTESIDHAGYFIQMGMASMPKWMEFVLDRKYPAWRNVERYDDGQAKYLPAGVRLLEVALAREYPRDDIAACYPDDLHRFIGPRTRMVAASTHNPLGVTFAAGVYTSIFGTSKAPINSHYARAMFQTIKESPFRKNFKVIVGGSGGWQVKNTNAWEELGIDTIVEGRAESKEAMALVRQAIEGKELPREVNVGHPTVREDIMTPDRRTTFGVVEMTTGCGRRCHFCLPDLNPQIDVAKDKILEAVKANVENGNKQVSLATEDMFIWGQVHTDTPFFFPNREALVDLYKSVCETPGVEQNVLSHCTVTPAVVDPVMIKQLSDTMLDKSPIHLPTLSTHPKKKALTPLLGLETASVSMARKIMPSKGVPFSIDDWPSIVLEGLRVMNENNWFPMITLMIGNPGETDEDVKATIDLIYEMERRNLFGFLVPSVFTPLHDTRMEQENGVTETINLTPLQWQLIMKCWKANLRPGQYSWWAPLAWRLGSLFFWATKLRKTNGPNFTWPLLMFASALPEWLMEKMGKIYVGKPMKIKTRKELLATLRKGYWKYLREDCGDLPEGWTPPPPPQPRPVSLPVMQSGD